MDSSPIWIKINYGTYCLLKGVDKFESSLKCEYIVQHKKQWLPAASEGNEIWFNILLNEELLKFVRDYLITKAIDKYLPIVAQYIKTKFSTFFSALDDFVEVNGNALDVQKFTIEYDDVKICLHGLSERPSVLLHETLIHIFKEIIILQNRGIDGISQIDMPVNKTDDGYRVICFGRDDVVLGMFKITYDFGCNVDIYDSTIHEFVKQ